MKGVLTYDNPFSLLVTYNISNHINQFQLFYIWLVLYKWDQILDPGTCLVGPAIWLYGNIPFL